jgi:hypothetical protein
MNERPPYLLKSPTPGINLNTLRLAPSILKSTGDGET